MELTTILGTIQATLTDFKYLSPEWKKNTEEERLLGVSLTGIMDHPVLNGSNKETKGFEDWDAFIEYDLENLLEELRNHARETNKTWSKILGIPESASITCVKPSGTVSQLVDSASGIHSRHADYYIRRLRMDKKDPMYRFLRDKGVPIEDCVRAGDTTAILSFPIKAPDGAITRNDRTALQQLELWLIYQRHWCEHKPSVTISVRDEEWPAVLAWVWEHFDEVSGISFLPYDGGSYQQAPYEDLTKEAYEAMVSAIPKDIDFEAMLEESDVTEGSQTLACSSAGGCEI